MGSGTLDLLSLLITVGAVAFAVVVGAIAMRATISGGGASRWREKAKDLDHKMSRAEAIFGSYPGLILVWEEKSPDPSSDWGKPKVFGSTAALASLVRFAEPGKPKDFTKRVLDGLADHDTISSVEGTQTLRQLVSNLRRKGEAFSATISMPGGILIEADGNVAGAQVVLWLEDASIRGQDERDAITQFEVEKLTAFTDPVAFVDIMGKAPFPIWRMSGTGRIVWTNNAYIQAVGAQDLQSVINEQIQLDESCADQAIKL